MACTEISVMITNSALDLAEGAGTAMTLTTWKIASVTALTVLIGVMAAGPGLIEVALAVRQTASPADSKPTAEAKDKEVPQEKKARGYLGIRIRSDEDSGAVIVHEVIADSPAAKAGLQEEDVILKVGSVEAKDRDTVVKAVAALKPGDKVTIRFKRDGKEMSASVTIGKQPDKRNE
jgi:S1-C subfamily serine protease